MTTSDCTLLVQNDYYTISIFKLNSIFLAIYLGRVVASQGVHPCIGVLQGIHSIVSFFSFSFSNKTLVRKIIILFLLFYSHLLLLVFSHDISGSRHHQHGRWQARIGRVAGNKDLYLGTFSK